MALKTQFKCSRSKRRRMFCASAVAPTSGRSIDRLVLRGLRLLPVRPDNTLSAGVSMTGAASRRRCPLSVQLVCHELSHGRIFLASSLSVKLARQFAH
ncbi:hypothetical protein [Candidatus Amarolinea dominans]|uniref:hypothetical protein n=1 Tax=Candidatus Amarolinea dominans TaxID=3140696 RepID=UPI003135E694|nr:hypothetical protein [Anaerolineae bacterium]